MELLERETYLAALNAALAEAASGAGRVALVSSEVAIGKTSLVERFTQGQRGKALMRAAMQQLGMSARSFHRVLMLARTMLVPCRSRRDSRPRYIEDFVQ